MSKLVISSALPHSVPLIESELPTTRPAASAHHSQPHLLPNPHPHLLHQTSASLSSPHATALVDSSPGRQPSSAGDSKKPSSDGQPSPNQAPSSDSPQNHVEGGCSGKPSSTSQGRSVKPSKSRNLHQQQVKLILIYNTCVCSCAPSVYIGVTVIPSCFSITSRTGRGKSWQKLHVNSGGPRKGKRTELVREMPRTRLILWGLQPFEER